MNGVIYARYSSEGQREESIEGQIRECLEYCQRNGITILQNYIDRAFSAKTDNRPDFLRMVRDSTKGLFEVVVVWKLDRFARNRYDSAHYKAALKKNGVRVLSAKENIADGPEGIILESMLEGMAEYYSAELSEKVIRGHTENALKCKYNGGTPTFGYTITLIDEPEAFLHPPQARLLGKMLAKNNPDNRQLLISTHSEDFLQGLLDADSENVTVIRINRDGNINRMSVLKNDEIKKLWGNPILRYSNILSGLFHEKVVVCESDYDCLFYQAIMDAIYEHKNEIAPDILFTHCGGKTRIKDVVSALKAVNVPVAAICDFDLLNSSQNFKPITASFGLDWRVALSADMKAIYDGMNAKNSGEINAWDQIKKVGKAGFTGNEPAAYEKVEAASKSAGLFVVPVGEMECFDKTVNKEKKDWVYYVLENYNLATEAKLEEARKFVQAVVDYKPL